MMKEISSEYSLEGLMLKLKLQYFGHLMQRTDSLEKTLMGMTEDETVGWHHQLHGHEFEQAPGDGEGQGSPVCCSPWGCKVLDNTDQWTELKLVYSKYRKKARKAKAYWTKNWSYCKLISTEELRLICNTIKITPLTAQLVSHLPAMQETRVWFLAWEDPLEKEMSTHSNILGWTIPWTEEPDRL